ncbi:MAG: universal stress protein [Actinomycetota bacterium]|uniref:universal stress protein n=1 Tax=Microbacterium sp. NPDC076768 TaxID=3154858 RepID=UPI003352DDEF
MFSHLLVPIDGTAHSEAVLRQARELAVLTGASAHILHLSVHEWIEGQDLTMEDTSEIRTFMEHALASFRSAGLTTTSEVLPADVREIGQAILARLEPEVENLIVIGAPHHQRWLAPLAHRISDQVTQQAVCPVLLIP